MSFESLTIIFITALIGASYGLMFGGGALLVLPVMFFLGIDPKVAIATNLTAVLPQLIIGSVQFVRYKKVDFKSAKKIMPVFTAGAVLGAFVLMNIQGDLIKKAVAAGIIFFAVISLLNRKVFTRKPRKLNVWQKITGPIAFFFNGIYQVSVMAGAGTVSTFILIYLYGLDIKKSIGTKQLIHIPTIGIPVIILISQGMINWLVLIPLIMGRIIGALISVKIMLKVRSGLLSVIFSVVVLLLALKVLLF